jgi:hypothetical protein
MRVHTLLIVAAVSSAAVTLSCGTAARCGPQTCSTGCCDTSGLCQTGSASGACGSRGNTCSVCGLGTACSFGACLGSSGAGMSGAGGGTSGVGGGSSSVGGGSSGVGGGSSGVGGGSSGVGGGSSGVGGGSSGVGGGSSGVGGGSSGVGGGTSGVGGGTSGVGGGSSGVGGGTSVPVPCDYLTPSCPTGSECVLSGVNGTAGTCLPGCSLTLQNCGSPNTKCIVAPTADGGIARQCTPFSLGSGGAVEGSSCVQALSDPCQRGAQCVGVSGGQPTCRRFCAPAVACGAGSECNLGITFMASQGGAAELHLVCSPVTACNPFTQSPCQQTEACQVYRQGAPPGCFASGSVSNGGQCTAQALCARGSQCVVGSGGAATGTCRSFCNVDGGSPSCAAGMCQNLMGSGIGTCSM